MYSSSSFKIAILHFMMSETCITNNNILTLTRKLDGIIQGSRLKYKNKEMDEEVAIQVSTISEKIDQCNRRLHHINKFYRKVQLMESYTERQYQTVLLTTLIIDIRYVEL